MKSEHLCKRKLDFRNEHLFATDMKGEGCGEGEKMSSDQINSLAF